MIHSPLDYRTWHEALARNTLAMAERCVDETTRAALLHIAEGWALLAHLQTAERKDGETA